MTAPTDSFFRLRTGTGEKRINQTLKKLLDRGLKGRLLDKDPSLWSDDPAVQNKIKNRLGWLTSPAGMSGETRELSRFARELSEDGIRDVILLGMGGSSLGPEVCRRTFGVREGFPNLHVLDTTVPAAILNVEKKISLDKTLFIVASKSGTTLEVTSLYRYFSGKVREAAGLQWAERFVAITDPGSPLEKTGKDEGFRKIFLNPADIGGRYSALSFFGLVPAALIGVDPDEFLKTIDPIFEELAAMPGESEETAIPLGVAMGELANSGKDKLTFFLSPKLKGFGIWAEQLIAESTGKEGKGVIPVDGEPPAPPGSYHDDRFFVLIQTAEESGGEAAFNMDALERAGHPTARILLKNTMELAAEFLRWEIATAVAGVVLGINPFDEPNVTESKENTRSVLKEAEETGTISEPPPRLSEGSLSLFEEGKGTHEGSFEGALRAFFEEIHPGDYVALLAYFEQSGAADALLEKIRTRLRDSKKAATTLGYGPRFLHSTGQLHKGGPEKGVFIQLTSEDPEDLPIPGETHGFSVIKRAQARGDLLSLTRRGFRVIRLHLGRDHIEDLKTLSGIINAILG
ncbi:MAG TPA: glucose-6-phosphate isomerase [Nitrospiria bacterium]